MATTCPPLKIQQFDDNGDPAVGWKLLTYETGTTTPKATYTAADGLTPNSNPIILDARGEATVFLGAGQYRFRLTTDADVLKWTQDGISAITQSAGTGILVAADGEISINEASASNAYSFTNSPLVMTTRRMRDLLYCIKVDGTTPQITHRSANASGWSVVNTGTGSYLITHSLGLIAAESLIVVATPCASNRTATRISQSANAFTIETRNNTDVLTDTDFTVHAVRVGG